MRAVVYTAITKGYDSLKMHTVKGAIYKSFIDPEMYHHPDPCRRAKFPKIMAHAHLECDYSLWVDGSVTLKPDLDMAMLIEKHLSGCDLAVMRHPNRDCIYDEAECIIKLEKDDALTVQKYVELSDMPKHWGLFETGFVLRRHTDTMNLFEQAWWRELVHWSRRDQLSLPVILKRTGMPFGIIEGRPYHSVGEHLVAKGKGRHTWPRKA